MYSWLEVKEFLISGVLALAGLISGSLGLGGSETATTSDQVASIARATTTAQVVQVLDGDTIDVRIDEKRERVRYIGIDAPEMNYDTGVAECYADEATKANRDLVAGREVQLVSGAENRDDYERLLRYVYLDDTFINQKLIEAGYAKSLPIEPNTSFARDFYKAERKAKSNNLGMWLECS